MQRSEIGAALDHLCVSSPEPERLAAFFAKGYGMQSRPVAGGLIECSASQRRVYVKQGPAHQAAFFAYSLADHTALGAFRSRLMRSGVALDRSLSPEFDDTAFAVNDPDGNIVIFGVRTGAIAPTEGLPARLQHIVFRSINLDAMVEFYEHKLGFVVSDRVKDGDGVLRACFMRTDVEHHSLAVFRSPESRLDHHSYETTDWEHIRRWADHLARRDIPIFWGVGRHGPGDDLFFMVKDPDDNLVEISAEIEQCNESRTEGLWPHGERTLNVWGNAILRS